MPQRVLVVAGKEMSIPEFLKVAASMAQASPEDADLYLNSAAKMVEDLQDEATGATHVEALEQAELARQQAATRRDQEIAKFFVKATEIVGTFSTVLLNELRKKGETV